MKLFGYSDRWSVRPGESVAFMVSCELTRYRVDMVRLLQADDRPEGPGFRGFGRDHICVWATLRASISPMDCR